MGVAGGMEASALRQDEHERAGENGHDTRFPITDVREWFTCAELAELALPGLPRDKRSLNRRARDERWQLRARELAGAGGEIEGAQGEPLARPRIGRGGGTEFHVSLLPGAARIELARRGLTCAYTQTDPECLSEPEDRSAGRLALVRRARAPRCDAEAERRLRVIVGEVELLEAFGRDPHCGDCRARQTCKVVSSSRRCGTGSPRMEGVARVGSAAGARAADTSGGGSADRYRTASCGPPSRATYLRLSGADADQPATTRTAANRGRKRPLNGL